MPQGENIVFSNGSKHPYNRLFWIRLFLLKLVSQLLRCIVQPDCYLLIIFLILWAILAISELIKQQKAVKILIQSMLEVGILCVEQAHRQLCPPQAPRAEHLGCHLPLLLKWRAWSCDSPPVLLLLRPLISLSEHSLVFSHKRWLLIRWVLSTVLSSPGVGHFVNVRPCCVIGSRLDLGAWVRLVLITSSLVLSDRPERWGGDETLVWYGEEQMLSLLPVCLCGEEPRDESA